MNTDIRWTPPLRKFAFLPDAKGTFGFKRKHHTHEGIDIYCTEGQDVFAVEAGVVVGVEWFTGNKCIDYPSPWWNDAQAVLVEGRSGVVVYGELLSHLRIGDTVDVGSKIGNVSRVLKNFKGRPMEMLHLELHRHGTRNTFAWDGSSMPESLLDPTQLIEEAYLSSCIPYKRYVEGDDRYWLLYIRHVFGCSVMDAKKHLHECGKDVLLALQTVPKVAVSRIY